MIMGFITDIHTHKQIYQWSNTRMGKMQLFIFLSKVNMTEINLSSPFNFCQKDFIDATISIEKSTSEIDADLAQNKI